MGSHTSKNICAAQLALLGVGIKPQSWVGREWGICEKVGEEGRNVIKLCTKFSNNKILKNKVERKSPYFRYEDEGRLSFRL